MKKTLLLLLLASISIIVIMAFIPHPYTYDAEKAADYVTNNAAKSSKGLCAQYVRLALERGGCNTMGHPFAANGYNDFMLSLDFTRLNARNYKPRKGDVVVFSAVKGHPYGHIAMWNGRQWVSDFRQKGLFVADSYMKAGNQKYYRMTKKHPKRHFKLKHYVNAYAVEPLYNIFYSIVKLK